MERRLFERKVVGRRARGNTIIMLLIKGRGSIALAISITVWVRKREGRTDALTSVRHRSSLQEKRKGKNGKRTEQEARTCYYTKVQSKK